MPSDLLQTFVVLIAAISAMLLARFLAHAIAAEVPRVPPSAPPARAPAVGPPRPQEIVLAHSPTPIWPPAAARGRPTRRLNLSRRGEAYRAGHDPWTLRGLNLLTKAIDPDGDTLADGRPRAVAPPAGL